jgi:hypothetical protein
LYVVHVVRSAPKFEQCHNTRGRKVGVTVAPDSEATDEVGDTDKGGGSIAI